MKYISYCIIPFLVLCVDLHAQQIISNSLVETENQKNPDVVKINQLWTDYLMSSPDSLYNNPYWNCRDKENYKSYDLLRSRRDYQYATVEMLGFYIIIRYLENIIKN